MLDDSAEQNNIFAHVWTDRLPPTERLITERQTAT